MSSPNCSDCETKVSAKTLSSDYTGNECLAIGDVCNPIRDELTPSQNEMRPSWYNGLHIVPYMGENHLSLKLFSKLANLSPTQGACIQSIKDYALGGEFTVNYRKREGFANTEEDREVSTQDTNAYIDFIESFTSGRDLYKIANTVYDNQKETGNSWIQVIFTQTAGVRSAELKAYDQLNVRYKYTPLGAPRMAYVSEEWSTTYLSQHPPVLIPVYPYVAEMGDGVFSTFIHEANLTTDRRWYGVPDSMNSIYFQWLEVMRGDFTQKEYGNGFTGKQFIEIEGDTENSDYSQVAASFRRVFTRKGEAKNLVLRQRSESQKPATVKEFKPNTDEKFQQYVADDCELQIIKSHNWDGALIGISKSGKLGSSEELNRLYRWKFQTVVKPWQNKVLAPINLAINLVAEWMGMEQMNQYSLGLTNPMRDLLEEEAKAAREVVVQQNIEEEVA